MKENSFQIHIQVLCSVQILNYLHQKYLIDNDNAPEILIYILKHNDKHLHS